MDLSSSGGRISAEDWVKRFTDGRYLFCCEFDHRAMDCALRKKAQNVQVGTSGGHGTRNEGRFPAIGKRLCQHKQDGALVDEKSFALNAIKCGGILPLSVSKVLVLDGSTEGKHLVITCTLTENNQLIHMHALIDCRALGISFINQHFVRHHQIPPQQLKEKNQVEVIGGRVIETGYIPHIAKVGMGIRDQKEQLPMFLTMLGLYSIVLGIPWLLLHDLVVRFISNTVSFGSRYCTTHCHHALGTV